MRVRKKLKTLHSDPASTGSVGLKAVTGRRQSVISFF